jgi:hypothetical protein
MASPPDGYAPAVSLRGHPVEETATLPDGREVVVRIGLLDDPYIKRRENDTITLDLVIGDEVEATVETVLEPQHVSEARALAREVAGKLSAGELQPTAGSVEHIALTIPG